MLESPIMKWFNHKHLTDPDMKAVSKAIGDVARELDATLIPSAEKSVALRHLLDAKDAAVRATKEGMTEV